MKLSELLKHIYYDTLINVYEGDDTCYEPTLLYGGSAIDCDIDITDLFVSYNGINVYEGILTIMVYRR